MGVQCEGGWVWVACVKVNGCGCTRVKVGGREVCMVATAVSVRTGC